MAVPPAEDSAVLVAVDRGDVPDDLVLGGETGVIMAKGTAEVNFAVKLTWIKP